MEISFQESEDSQLLLTGLDLKPSSSRKSSLTAAGCLPSAGREYPTSETSGEQTSLFGEEELMFCQEDSPASRSVVPGSSAAAMMSVTSGRQCGMLSRRSGLFGSFVKTCLESSAWGSSSEFVWIWSTSVTRHNRLLYLLTPLGQSTKDSGSSLWPTPRKEGFDSQGEGHSDLQYEVKNRQMLWRTVAAADADRGALKDPEKRTQSKGINHSLPNQAAHPNLWPTPHANCVTGAGTQGRDGGMNLQTAAKLWPTPQATDAMKRENHVNPEAHIAMRQQMGATNSAITSLTVAAKLWPTPTVPNGGRRNPEGTSITGKKPDGGKAQIDLREFALRMFPTPTSRDYKDGTAEACANVPVNGLLRRAVHHLLPTPVVNDARNGRNATANRSDPNSQHHAGTTLSDMAYSSSGSLSPMFVEWLMGFPLGWTELRCPLRSAGDPIKSEIDHTALKPSETRSSRPSAIPSSRRSRKPKET